MPALLIYIYDLNNTLKGRIINGVTQNFVYDKKGQLTGVTDSNGAVLESYKYDAAGNILEKVINGVAVNYTYDKANQLLTATMPDGIRKSYKYDAAGRLVEETAGTASKSYSYGWSDKVTKVTDGKTESSFSYYPNGQLAKRNTDKASEDFYWDGLALLKRDNTNYLNEPYVTGGNPVLADDKLVFNDMLGTSIGSMEDGNFKYIPRTAFGETEDKSAVNFFTGKPDVADLGYNFMFRNYRADLGKWQTQDPLGYPDGWNNLAYCNSHVMNVVDSLGLEENKKLVIINRLKSVATSDLAWNKQAQALLDATVSKQPSQLVKVLGDASEKIEALNNLLPDNTPGKAALDKINDYVSKGATTASAVEKLVDKDPTFVLDVLKLADAGSVPGIDTYLEFISSATTAIADAINTIKIDEAYTASEFLSDPTIGDYNINRMIESEWLVPKSYYDEYYKKLNE